MRTADFDYHLPPERIAQTPVEPRHASRLMVLRREDGTTEHSTFWNIGNYLRRGDLLVINRTRVIPARLMARKPSGGKVEILLLRRINPSTWEALVGGKKMVEGRRVQVEGGSAATITAVLDGPRRLVRFESDIEPFLQSIGRMPLPPYIHTRLEDPERYQTVYADIPGSAAAPTAGLHFTPELMEKLESSGIRFATLTLHVGLDTFAPVNEEEVQQHTIHTEWCELTAETALAINRARQEGGRIIAVGTTSVRTLESAARLAPPGKIVAPFTGATDLFIYPGHAFRAVDAMVTNFHLPRSTLLMLVSAFYARERLLEAYRQAMAMDYRFYSFGDAMLIL